MLKFTPTCLCKSKNDCNRKRHMLALRIQNVLVYKNNNLNYSIVNSEVAYLLEAKQQYYLRQKDQFYG
jgi:hypothetical protein